MSANDYIRERKAYTGKDPCNSYGKTAEGITKERNPSVTRKATADRKKALDRQYAEAMRSKGIGPADAKRLGAAKAKHELSQQAALHNQDMVAGGQDAIGALKADGARSFGAGDFGDRGTNSHIGSQWNGGRVQDIDKQACEKASEGRGDERLDVELRPCGKHEAKAAGCKGKSKRKGKKS